MARTRKLLTNLAYSCAVLAISGCTFLDSFVPKSGETTDVIDRQQNLTINDFRDLNNAKKLLEEKNDPSKPVVPKAELGAPPIPDIAQVLAAPRAPKLANTKLVTLSVTEDVPLRDVLFELGRIAKVDIEVGSGLDKTGINLRATDQPFNEVIERIAELGNLRYTQGKSSIRVEKDTAYIKTYPLDFLNVDRSSTSDYSLSTAGGGGGSSSSGGSSGSSGSGGGNSGGSGGSSGGGGGGSSASITAKSESDLWDSLESSISEVLSYKPDGADSSQTNQAPSFPVGGGSSGAAGKSSGFTINRQAGLLTVTATDRQHEMIRRFLNLMSRNTSAQVLIEAKIVEVALTDQYASGVDWSKVLGDGSKNYISGGKYIPTDPATSLDLPMEIGSKAAVFSSARDLGAILAMTQTFGTLRTLSSPRLSAINNQSAVLTFATNEVYYECTYTPAQTNTPGAGGAVTQTQATFTCEKQTVPIGIVLNILPSIDLDTQEVTLSVRPTLTSKIRDVVSPETGFLKAQLNGDPDNLIPPITAPEIQVREIDSIAKVKTGGVMIIGGLMEDKTINTEAGVPGVGELPIFGNLFKSRAENSSKRELIVLIKATIVNSNGNTAPLDRAIIKKYVTDPRPAFPEDQ